MLETLETPVHSQEKKIVLKAISESPGRITAADMSLKTGMPVLQTTGLLNQIAYETGGHLAVGTAGSVAYEFDKNFQSAYITRGSKNFFKRIWRIVFNASLYVFRILSLVMFFLIRVSFGIMLILSVVLVLVLVVVAVVALLSKVMGDNDSDGPDFDIGGLLSGMGGFFRYWIFDWLWDWWYWGQYLGWRRDPYPVPTSEYGYDSGKKEKKESFLDKVFSFLFGDGDPNADLTERYWQTLARVIKAHKGVLTADELAPYTAVEGSGEDWVLPILIRFNGAPEVSEAGNLIYKFPSFQKSAPIPQQTNVAPDADEKSFQLHDLVSKSLNRQKINREAELAASELPIFLREHPWEFSHIGTGARAAIISFAVFISVGSLWLISLASSIPIIHALSALLVAVAIYGALVLIVPTIRYLVLQGINKKIEERNAKRQDAASRLRSPDSALLNKMAEADKVRKESLAEAGAETVIYSTRENALDQDDPLDEQFKKEFGPDA